SGRYLQRVLLVAVNDPAAGQIVWAELNDHAVLGEDADVVLTHLAANRGKNAVAVGQLNAEHRVGQSFDYCAFDLNDTVFFGHTLTVAQSRSHWSCGWIVVLLAPFGEHTESVHKAPTDNPMLIGADSPIDSHARAVDTMPTISPNNGCSGASPVTCSTKAGASSSASMRRI